MRFNLVYYLRNELSNKRRPCANRSNLLAKPRKKPLIDVACELRNLSVKLLERLERNSSNSSKPPSSNDPYKKRNKGNSDSKDDCNKNPSAKDKKSQPAEKVPSSESLQPDNSKRSAGRQPGSQGFWRSETPVPESTIPHYPGHCVICGKKLMFQREVDHIWGIPSLLTT